MLAKVRSPVSTLTSLGMTPPLVGHRSWHSGLHGEVGVEGLPVVARVQLAEWKASRLPSTNVIGWDLPLQRPAPPPLALALLLKQAVDQATLVYEGGCPAGTAALAWPAGVVGERRAQVSLRTWPSRRTWRRLVEDTCPITPKCHWLAFFQFNKAPTAAGRSCRRWSAVDGLARRPRP